MNIKSSLFFLVFVFLLSACGAVQKTEEAKDITDYSADDFLQQFVSDVEDNSFIQETYEIEIPDPLDEYYRMVRFEGDKIIIASFQDDGIIFLSSFNTFQEQKEPCLRFFAYVLGVFSSESNYESDLADIRNCFNGMGTNNTKSIFRDYIQIRMVTEADASTETGGFVYFIIGKNR